MRLPHGACERLDLGGPAEQAECASGGLSLGPQDRTREQRVDVLLADDGRFECTRLSGRLESELLVEAHAEAAVAAQRLVRSADRVERQHLRALCPLAEAIEGDRRFRMRKRGAEVVLGQGRVGGFEMSPEDTTLVAAAQVEGPGGVRLVLQDVAAHEAQRLLERGASAASRFATGALQQLVEAVEVERDELGREAVRLRLRDDELACPLAVRREVAAKHGNERLERAGDVVRPLVTPQELGQAVGGNTMAARGQQDLEDLLRPHAAEVAWSKAARALLDREGPEQPDHRPLPLLNCLAQNASPGGGCVIALRARVIGPSLRSAERRARGHRTRRRSGRGPVRALGHPRSSRAVCPRRSPAGSRCLAGSCRAGRPWYRVPPSAAS